MYSNIQKWGNSQAVRLPKVILETALLKENDSIQIIAEKNQIIIKKAIDQNHKTLKERLKNFDGNYKYEEWDTGESVGNEVLQ